MTDPLGDSVPLELTDMTAAMNIALVAQSAVGFLDGENAEQLEDDAFMRGVLAGLLIAVAVAVENPAGTGGGTFAPADLRRRGTEYAATLLAAAKDQHRSMS